MSIETTLETLQTKHAGIAGVTSAPTKFPSSINTVDLPLVITLPAEGSWSTQAVGLNRQDRVYRVLVFIEAVGQATVDQRMNEAIPILTLFGAEYLNDLGIVADDNIDHVRMPITDTGIISLPFGDIEYIGFEMRITITEKS